MANAAEARLSEIHRVACRLFREKGYPGTSVRDIAQAVGIKGGSLYTHMAGKEDLLWEIVDAAAERFFAAMRPIVEGQLDVMQRLKAAIIAHVEVIAEDTDAAAVFTVEWRHLSPERRAQFTARRDEYERLFRGMLRQAIEQRLVAAPDEATAALWRPMAEMNMTLMYVVTLLYSAGFVAIYGLLVEPKCVGRGIKYGAIFGLATGISMGFGTYAYMPIPGSLAWSWFLASFIEALAAGAIVGAIMRTCDHSES